MPPEALVRVENSRLFLQPVSATFQGRDILAPVAAHLSMGMALKEIGAAVDFSQVVRLEQRRPRETGDGEITGEVLSADRFGNLRTNIDASMLDRLRAGDSRRMLVVRIGSRQIEGMSSHYAQREQGGLVALVGSRNQLEIAVNGGSARDLFPEFLGLEVRVRMQPKTTP
jgi:S-adenosylmethionine hydrolase